MTIAGWFSWISASVIATAVGFVGGVVLRPLISQAIAHGLNRNIEDLKSALRKNEEEFRAAIKARDDEFATLRSTALERLSARRAALDGRRLEAAERIWNAVVDQGRFKLISKMTQSIKFEVALDAAAKEGSEAQKLRAFGDTIWKAANVDEIPSSTTSPDKERPFVSPIAWARFATYRHMVLFPVAQLAALRSGAPSTVLADPKPLLDAIKAALPNYSNFVDQYGSAAVSHLIDDMEGEVLKEIIASLEDGSAHEKHFEEATQILSAVRDYSESLETRPKAPVEGVAVIKKENP